MKAFNLRSNRHLALNVEVADSPLKRMKGLLGRDSLRPGEALLLRPCNWIHTVGMRFPIDIVFLSKDNTILKAEENVPPNRFSAFVFRAVSAVELPAGTVSATDSRAGDQIEMS